MESADFTLHRIQGYLTTLYLVEYEHGLLLLDCGVSGDAGRVKEYCEQELQRPVQDIKLAVASHYHPDHGGGAHVLRQYGIPLAAHPEIDRWYAGFGGFLQHKLDSYMAQILAKTAKIPLEKLTYPRKMRPDILLEDNSRLPFFEDWQVLWTPGHTACDISLFHPGSGTLCIFDMVNVVKGRYHLPLPVLMHAEMAESFDKLAALAPRLVLVAHGPNEGLQLQPEDFIAMRDKVWLPPGVLGLYAYRMTWASTAWHRYRRAQKAAGKPVIPASYRELQRAEVRRANRSRRI